MLARQQKRLAPPRRLAVAASGNRRLLLRLGLRSLEDLYLDFGNLDHLDLNSLCGLVACERWLLALDRGLAALLLLAALL